MGVLSRLRPGRRRSGEAPSSPAAIAAVAERILTEDVLPFWAGLVDEDHGGYRLNHDAAGRYRGPGEKFVVTQARMVWFFSRLAREGRMPLDGATAGYRFLREALWDSEHGGFHWAVDDTGREPTRVDKHMYGQAFGLFALCEYARASGDVGAAALAGEFFSLLDDRAHDASGGGYRECFTRSWEPADPGRPGYLGKLPDRKLLNTHLHVLEALTAAAELGGGERERERLAEVAAICGERAVDRATGGCRDEHLRDWTPLTGGDGDRVSYGHDLENVSLLLAAAPTIGVSRDEALERCRPICAHAVAHGYDADAGGFFRSGPLGRSADHREKVWWAQAEGMLCMERMWRATDDGQYLERLARTLGWVDERQVDRAGGDWHDTVAPSGESSGDKAGQWKDPYHQTRALLAVAALSPP